MESKKTIKQLEEENLIDTNNKRQIIIIINEMKNERNRKAFYKLRVRIE